MVAASGLEDGTADAVPPQPFAQGAAARLVIGEAAGEPAGFEMRIEPTLADVNAGNDGGHAVGGRELGSGRAARYTVRVHVLRLVGLY